MNYPLHVSGFLLSWQGYFHSYYYFYKRLGYLLDNLQNLWRLLCQHFLFKYFTYARNDCDGSIISLTQRSPCLKTGVYSPFFLLIWPLSFFNANVEKFVKWVSYIASSAAPIISIGRASYPGALFASSFSRTSCTCFALFRSKFNIRVDLLECAIL